MSLQSVRVCPRCQHYIGNWEAECRHCQAGSPPERPVRRLRSGFSVGGPLASLPPPAPAPSPLPKVLVSPGPSTPADPLPDGTQVERDAVPPEYREGGRPDGEVLTTPYLKDSTNWLLKGPHLTKH